MDKKTVNFCYVCVRQLERLASLTDLSLVAMDTADLRLANELRANSCIVPDMLDIVFFVTVMASRLVPENMRIAEEPAGW